MGARSGWRGRGGVCDCGLVGIGDNLQARIHLANDINVLGMPAAHVITVVKLPQQRHACGSSLVLRNVVKRRRAGRAARRSTSEVGGGGGAWADVCVGQARTGRGRVAETPGRDAEEGAAALHWQLNARQTMVIQQENAQEINERKRRYEPRRCSPLSPRAAGTRYPGLSWNRT